MDADRGLHIKKLVSRWLRLGLVTASAIVLLTVWRPAAWTPVRIAGACLIVAGLALWMVAQVQLGDSFSVRPQAHALVTRGVYSRIRNPIYVFSAIFISGVAMFMEGPLWLLFLVVLIPVQIVRARREARVLEAKFGEEYRAYRRNTWF
jgi:protein-S-isoprenylcysteine O-methyltransferase Ste14